MLNTYFRYTHTTAKQDVLEIMADNCTSDLVNISKGKPTVFHNILWQYVQLDLKMPARENLPLTNQVVLSKGTGQEYGGCRSTSVILIINGEESTVLWVGYIRYPGEMEARLIPPFQCH